MPVDADKPGFLTAAGPPGAVLCVMTLVLAAMGVFGVWPPGDGPGLRPFDSDGVMMEISLPDRPRGVYAFPGDFSNKDLAEALPGVIVFVSENEELLSPHRIRRGIGEDRCHLSSLSGAAELALGRKMNLCRARALDLMLLPGIGPKRARALAAHIRRAGSIKTIDDLAKAPGIGPETVAGLQPWARTGDCERAEKTP